MIDHPIFGAVLNPFPKGVLGDILRYAIEHHREARRVEADIAERLPEDLPDYQHLQMWTDWALGGVYEADVRLVLAILGTRADFDRRAIHKAEKRAWTPCGVAHEGKLYLVVPATDDDLDPGESDRDGHDVMKLAVIDREDVLGLATPIPHVDDPDPDDLVMPRSDEEEADGEGPAAGPPHVARYAIRYRDYLVRVWTEAEWAGLPEDRRPGRARRIGTLGWIDVVPAPDDLPGLDPNAATAGGVTIE